MKLYQYEELRKLNQALGSFKRNEIPIKKVKLLTIGSKVIYFVLTDPKYEPRVEKVKKEVKKKAKTKTKEGKGKKEKSKKENKEKVGKEKK